VQSSRLWFSFAAPTSLPNPAVIKLRTSRAFSNSPFGKASVVRFRPVRRHSSPDLHTVYTLHLFNQGQGQSHSVAAMSAGRNDMTGRLVIATQTHLTVAVSLTSHALAHCGCQNSLQWRTYSCHLGLTRSTRLDSVLSFRFPFRCGHCSTDVPPIPPRSGGIRSHRSATVPTARIICKTAQTASPFLMAVFAGAICRCASARPVRKDRQAHSNRLVTEAKSSSSISSPTNARLHYLFPVCTEFNESSGPTRGCSGSEKS
jgi:hypothetical protein